MTHRNHNSRYKRRRDLREDMQPENSVNPASGEEGERAVGKRERERLFPQDPSDLFQDGDEQEEDSKKIVKRSS